MAILHPLKRVEAIVPNYVTRFSCVGPSCPDSCCSGWSVSIDRRTHVAYQQLQHDHLSDRMQTKLSRNRKGHQDVTYSRVEMDTQSGDCPFMEEKLCAIQRELGEDKLSNTCFSYPRFTTEVAGTRQQTMTLSCPEAARLALTSADAMEFSQAAMLVRPEQISVVTKRWGLNPETTNTLRFSTLQILQASNLELWERLAVLGFLCDTVSNLVRKGEQAQVEAAIHQARTACTSGAAKEALSPLRPDHAAQVIIFSELWAGRGVEAKSEVQRQVSREVAEGLGFTGQSLSTDQATLVGRYQSGLTKLHIALEGAPFVLQNYVLNDMFRELFPFEGSDATEHYRRLVVRYGIVRLMLAARCEAKERPLHLDEIVETVQVFARLHQHNAQFAKRAEESLKKANWDTLEKMFRFLRD